MTTMPTRRSFNRQQSIVKRRSLTINRFHSRFRLRSFRRSKISVQQALIAGKIEATEAMTGACERYLIREYVNARFRLPPRLALINEGARGG
jgi:hypothetical protein